MKYRVSSVAFRAALAAGLVVFGHGVASAADLTWTGDAGDGKWSTPGNWSGQAVPGVNDIAIFDGTANIPDATVDADYAGKANGVVIKKDYAGTLSLARDLRLESHFEQNGGTVTCGANDLWVGMNNPAGKYQSKIRLLGGTFNAPSKTLRWTNKGSTQFVINNEVNWNANGGTVLLDMQSTYQTYLYATNRVFSTLEFGGSTEGGVDLSKCYNNHVTGKLVHSGGVVTGGGTSTLFVDCPVEVKGKANGGSAWLTFNGDNDQEISFGEPFVDESGNAYARTLSLYIDKPAGRKVMVSASDGDGWARFGRCYTANNGIWSGFNVVSGLLDFSGCKGCDVYAARSYLTAWKGDAIAFPESFSAHSVGDGGGWRYGLFFSQPAGDAYVFTNLALHAVFTTYMYQTTTNLVKGTFTLDGAGIMQDYNEGNAGWDDVKSLKTGTIAVEGDIVVCQDTTPNATSHMGGNALVVACGTGDQNLYSTNGALPSLIVDKPAGSRLDCHDDGNPLCIRTWAADNSAHSGGHLILKGGTLAFPPSGVTWPNARSTYILQKGGVLEAGPGTVKIDGYIVKLGLTDPVGGFEFYMSQTMSANYLDLKNTLVVTGLYHQTGGRICNATVQLKGDCKIEGKNYGGNKAMQFVGDAVQHYWAAENASNVVGAITVNKTGGRLILDSDFDLCKRRDGQSATKTTTSQAVNLTAGTLDLNGHVLTLPPTGTTTVGEGFRFAFPAAEPEARACVVAADKLQFPATAGSVELELTGKLTPEAPSPISVFGYGSLVKQFDPAVFALVPNPLLSKRFKVTNDGTEKLISLAYAYKRGTLLYVR